MARVNHHRPYKVSAHLRKAAIELRIVSGSSACAHQDRIVSAALVMGHHLRLRTGNLGLCSRSSSYTAIQALSPSEGDEGELW